MLTITKAEAVLLIQAAYDAKQLQAQVRPNVEGADYPIECSYRSSDGSCKCAIGVLIPDDSPILENFNHYRVDDLIDRGMMKVDDEIWFTRIQSAHDTWLLTQGEYRANAERYFLKRLNQKDDEQ